jgi:hypothetical protein
MLLSIDDFAKYVFVEHDSSRTIDLQILGNLETSKEMFLFLIDLVCKGLVLMFGNNDRVDLDMLTMEQFAQLSRRLELLGIRCQLDVEQLEEPMSVRDVLHRLHLLHSLPDNLDLSRYTFEIGCRNVLYKIHFTLFHSGVDNCRNVCT